jgi:hypothetical protein
MDTRRIEPTMTHMLLVIGALLLPTELAAQTPSPPELLAIGEARSQTYAVNRVITKLEKTQRNTVTPNSSPDAQHGTPKPGN